MTEKHQERARAANPQAPVTNIVTYVPKKGKEAELLALVKKHEPALRKVGLVTSEPFRLWKAYDIRKEREQYIEYFVWKDGNVQRRRAPDTGDHGRVGADGSGARRNDDLRGRAALTEEANREIGGARRRRRRAGAPSAATDPSDDSLSARGDRWRDRRALRAQVADDDAALARPRGRRSPAAGEARPEPRVYSRPRLGSHSSASGWAGSNRRLR